MPGGRPRTVMPATVEETIALGEEMVAWVMEHQPVQLSEWYSLEQKIIFKDWKALIQRPEFLPYYEQARVIVSKHYIEDTKRVRDGIAHRFLRHVCPEIRESDDEVSKQKKDDQKELMTFEHELRQAGINPESELGQKFVDMMDQLTRAQSQRPGASLSVENKSSSNSSNDNRS